MVFFNKKESESKVPELPPYPEKISSLPPLPQVSTNEKNAFLIKTSLNESLPEIPALEDHTKFLPPEKKEDLIPSIQLNNAQQTQPPLDNKIRLVNQNDSIFVKIERYKKAKEEMEKMKKEILEIKSLIERLEEVKIKEDEELKEIDLNIEEIKKKINEVDLLVFDKL